MQSDSGHSAAHHNGVCVSWPLLTTGHKYRLIRTILVKIRARKNAFVRNLAKQFVKKEIKKRGRNEEGKEKKKKDENEENPRMNAVKKLSVYLLTLRE